MQRYEKLLIFLSLHVPPFIFALNPNFKSLEKFTPYLAQNTALVLKPENELSTWEASMEKNFLREICFDLCSKYSDSSFVLHVGERE